MDTKGSKLVERYNTEKWSMWSLDTGLEKLTETLADQLRLTGHVDIRLDTPCTGIEFSHTTCKVKVSKTASTLGRIVTRETVFTGTKCRVKLRY